MNDQKCKTLRFECIVDTGTLEEIELWLEEYVPAYLVQEFDISSVGLARIILSFDNCSDAVLFKLRWT